MKKLTCLILSSLLLAFTLSACNRTNRADPSAMQEAYLGAMVEHAEGDALIVYLPMQYTELDAVNDMLRSAGFNIVLKAMEIRPSPTFIRDLADAMRSEKAIWDIGHMPHRNFRELRELVKFGDFYEQARQHAPEYLEMASAANSPGSLTLMPTEFTALPLRPTVFIRKDVYYEYGKDITNGDEYLELLHWLKGQDDIGTPGLFVNTPVVDMSGYLWRSGGFMPLNLFLPGMGYSSLFELTSHGSVGNFLWMHDETGDILPFYEIEGVIDIFVKFYSLRDQDYLHFWDGEPDVGTSYPTILVSQPSRIGSLMTADEAMEHYVINIFHEPAVSYPPFSGGFRAVDGTDVSEFLRLMEWLNDPYNYTTFKFGTEGVDFHRDANGFIIPGSLSEYRTWDRFGIFGRDSQNNELFHFWNWVAEATRSLPISRHTLDPVTMFNVSEALRESNAYSNGTYRVITYISGLLERLDRVGGEADPVAGFNTVFEEIGRIPGLEIAEELIGEALRRPQ